jgi:diguanylate cyclase
LTETALVTDVGRAAKILRQLAALGVRITLDDFGTGYSSLTYLRSLPIDTVKIDRSFVADLDGAGVLSGLQCAYGQGYLFSRPLPPERLAELLMTRSAELVS